MVPTSARRINAKRVRPSIDRGSRSSTRLESVSEVETFDPVRSIEFERSNGVANAHAALRYCRHSAGCRDLQSWWVQAARLRRDQGKASHVKSVTRESSGRNMEVASRQESERPAQQQPGHGVRA